MTKIVESQNEEGTGLQRGGELVEPAVNGGPRA